MVIRLWYDGGAVVVLCRSDVIIYDCDILVVLDGERADDSEY